jgi:hypothetical protein
MGETSIMDKECIIFLYYNINEFSLFISRNKNSSTIAYCVSINLNFFEIKKWIKNNRLLNNKFLKLFFCFSMS